MTTPSPSRAQRAAYIAGALLILSGVLHLVILIFSGASWDGPVSFRKPMTFGLSFGVTVITIAWVSSFVRLRDRTRSAIVGIFTIVCVFETVLITLQAWRGVPSHFNVETPFDAQVGRGLAIGGVIIIASIVTLAIASFRAHPAVPISMRVAVRIGFVALVAAQAVGGLMIAKGMGLVFAGNRQAAYATGGTFKPSHAVTMHAIQLLPVLAWLLSFMPWPERRRLTIVLIVAAGYILIAGGIILTNILGAPL